MKSYAQRRSKLQEKRAARDIGGRRQKGSGSSPFAKGDFRNAGVLRGECKHTSKDVYVLKEEDLKKIQMEALRGGFEDWVFQVEFIRSAGQSKKYAVVDMRAFMDMWVDGRPAGYNSVSSTTSANVGKSYQLKLDELTAISGLHVHQVAFLEDKDSVPSKVYAVVAWQAYLDVRNAYDEKKESEG